MYLAYLDDADTKAKRRKWQVMSAVLIEDKSFKMTEMGMSVTQELLLPPEKLEEFEEFHACELYGGYGVFQGIEQDRRFEAIRQLLRLLEIGELSVVYGAVDLEQLPKEVYASADPLDICFRICARGITSCTGGRREASLRAKIHGQIEQHTPSAKELVSHIFEGVLFELILIIVDECDAKLKNTLHKSFLSLRPKRRPGQAHFTDFHDEMYFGDSRYSVGIQLADLCSYFIARHLVGDSETESFYEMIRPRIAYSEVHPPTTPRKSPPSQAG